MAKKSTPIPTIDTSRVNEWQGRRSFKTSNKRISWQWDKDQSRYGLVSTRVVKGKREVIQGIRATFFSARGVYPIAKFADEIIFERWFSNLPELLARRLFRSNDKQRRQGIRPSDFEGEVPLSFLFTKLNDFLGVDDFRKAYENWEYRYDVGNAVRWFDDKGKSHLKRVLDKGSIRRASKGFF